MNRDEFLKEFQEVIQSEDELTFEQDLNDIDEWDSLSVMATIAFIDKNFGIKVSHKDIIEMKTIDDIAKKVGL